MGIEPKERGGVIHKILKEFTQGLAAAAPDWPDDKGKALEFLEKTVDNILGKYLEDPFWQVERLRLLGDDESPGLLKEWLEKERERASEGWGFEVAEESFEELSIGDTGIVLNGRVDRVDSHPEKGKALWDYKTSDSPPDREVLEDMVRPQLPAYLLSLKQGHLPRLGEWSGQVKAGYITLKKASEVEIEDLKNVDWEDFLQRWKEWVKKRLEGPLKGLYSADPKPPPSSLQNEGACKHCPFPNLCDFKAQREEGEGSEDLQERGFMIHPTPPDQKIREEALDTSGNFILEAPAGSGKTDLLIARYLALLSKVSHPRQILAVTYTRKAAIELEDRIVQKLNQAKENEG